MEMRRSLKDPDRARAAAAVAAAEEEFEQEQRQAPLLVKLSAVFQENSIPAVRKCARSSSSGYRCFWAMVFLATFAGFVVHLISIAVRFNETPVSTETRVKKLDKMASILICPQSYLTDSRMRSMKDVPNPKMANMSFDEVYNDILPMFWNLIYKLRDASVDRKMVGLKIKNNFQWYLSNSWKAQIEHEKQDVFVHMYMQERQIGLRNISVSTDSLRNRCFAWRASGDDTQSLISILNVPDGRYFYAEQDAFELVSDNGLWLHICFNDAFGCHDSIRYFLEAGYYTKIDLRKTMVSQLPVSGQSQCANEHSGYSIKSDLFLNSSETVQVPYTSSICTDVEMQRRIYNQCKCLSVLLPAETKLYEAAIQRFSNSRRLFCSVPPDVVFIHKGFPSLCLKTQPHNHSHCLLKHFNDNREIKFQDLLSDPEVSQFLKRDECHDQLFKERYRIRSDCPKLCQRQQYSSVHSVVPWPQSQLSRQFADTFARIFVNTIKPYITKSLQQLKNSSMDSSVLRTVNKTFQEKVYVNFSKSTSYNKGMDYLTQRLLLLEIGYASSDMQVMSEVEAYPLKSFLSDIGGIMGLWIGMAIVSVCELLLITFRALIYVTTKCALALTHRSN